MQRILAVCSLLFLLPFSVRASGQTFISEIAWAGSSASLADEWFELCGPPGTDISGWSIEGAASSPIILATGSVIPASGAFVIANYPSDDLKSVLDIVPDVVTSIVSLSNSDLSLRLRASNGTVIDVAGTEGTPPFAGTSGEVKSSMERLDQLLSGETTEAWRSSQTSNGFHVGTVELGTPGTCTQSIAEEPIESAAPISSATSSEDVAVGTGAVATNIPLKNLSSVRVAEIYPSPKSGEVEWVELVNTSFMGEILDGLTIEDAKGTKTKLSGLILPWARLVIESPRGSLNNDGDSVIIREQDGRIVEHVDYPKTERGESYMRQEPQETFVMTLTPTPGATNIFTSTEKDTGDPAPSSADEISKPIVAKTLIEPAVSQIYAQVITTPDAQPATINVAEKTVTPAKTVIKKTAAKPKTTTVARYKGMAYSATVVVPPGVYSKTKSYILRDGAIEELRLSKSPSATWNIGDKISFIAQTKTESAVSYLLANSNSVRRTGSASTTFANTESWPEEAGGYRFTAEVLSLRGNALEVKLGDGEGDVLVPAGTAASLNPGDKVNIEGFVMPGARPQVVLATADALRLKEAHKSDVASAPYRGVKLPASMAIGLTFAAGLAGLAAYLRASRLKRLALIRSELE